MKQNQLSIPKTNLHRLIPSHLDAENLQEWLRVTSVDRFTDPQKRVYTPEEIAEFEHESAVEGREIMRLKEIVKEASALATKGTEEPVTFTIPVTVGTKKLDEFRNQNYGEIEVGAELTDVEIFGIVDHENESMEYFTLDGDHVADRSRPLSAKERHVHLGMFQKKGKVETDNQGNKIDEETGEVLNGTDG